MLATNIGCLMAGTIAHTGKRDSQVANFNETHANSLSTVSVLHVPVYLIGNSQLNRWLESGGVGEQEIDIPQFATIRMQTMVSATLTRLSTSRSLQESAIRGTEI